MRTVDDTSFRSLVRLLCCLSIAFTGFPAHAEDADPLPGESPTSSNAGQSAAQSAAANLFTGAATLSIPVRVPPGRGQATPDISLSYSSSSSNGGASLFGAGWSVPLGEVTRDTRNGVPTCEEDNEFTLSLPGATVELVYDSTDTFYAKTDEAFIEAVADRASNTWVVHDRAGRTYRFGTHPESRAWSGADIFSESSPGCNFTALWALTQIEEPNGNTIDFVYTKTTTPIISEILYGANPGAILSEHPFKIAFGTTPRQYTQRSYSLGVLQEVDVLIDSIGVFYKRHAGDSYHYVREYQLGYTESKHGGRAYLESLQERAPKGEVGESASLDDVTTLSRPAHTFTYADPDFGPTETLERPAPFGPAGLWLSQVQSSGNSHVESAVIDMNGDGIGDAVRASHGVSGGYWLVDTGGQSSFGTNQIEWDVTNLPSDKRELIRLTIRGDGNNYVRIDTMDITGDGIPDWIDTRGWTSSQPYWDVYPGKCVSATECEFVGPPTSWRAPTKDISRVQRTGGGYGSRTRRMVIDLNGDGYPDYIVATGASDPWTVYFGTSSGFADQPGAFAGSGFIQETDVLYSNQFGNANTRQIRRLMDFNGDGLPDLLESDSLQLEVRLNTGRGFGPVITSSLACEDPLCPTTNPNTWAAWSEGGITLDATGEVGGTTQSQNSADLVDINGDGLPDRVWVGPVGEGSFPYQSVSWYSFVQLNIGGGRLSSSVIELTPFLPDLMYLATQWTGNLSGEGRNTWILSSLLDLDANGVVEFVDATWGTEPEWVSTALQDPSTAYQRRGLLLEADDGLGGVTSFQYHPSNLLDNTGGDGVPDLAVNLWVTTAVRRTDGLCPTTPADPFDPSNPCLVDGHERLTRYEYAYGFFDTEAREFRGFGMVKEIDSHGNETETIFSQDDHTWGKVASRTVRAVNGNEASHDLEITINSWNNIADGPRTVVYLEETQTTRQGSSGQGPMCTVSRNDPPDEYGRVSQTCTFACGAEPAGTGCGLASTAVGASITETTWAPDGASYVRERPVEVATYYVRPGPSLVLLTNKRMWYDGAACDLPDALVQSTPIGRGNVTCVRSWLDQDPRYPSFQGGWVPPIEMAYDAFGNMVSSVDELGRETLSIFDPAQFSLYPAGIVRPATDGGVQQHITQRVTSLRFGKPVQLVDENNQVTQLAYDPLGRLICEAAPGDSLADCHSGTGFSATRELHYTFADPQAGSFEARHSSVEARSPNADAPSGYNSAWVFTDALGRERFRKVERTIGTANPTATPSLVIEGQSVLDSEGRVRVQYAAYVSPSALESPSSVGATTFSYVLNSLGEGDPDAEFIDPLGRVRVADPPGAERVVWTYKGRITDETHEDGSVRQTVTDDFGRVVNESVVGTDGSALSTAYTYDGAGRVLTREVGGESATLATNTYDTLGRLVERTDPNATGIWRHGYDSAGNLVYIDLPTSGHHVQNAYDELNRPVRRCVFSSSDAFDDDVSATSCASGTWESTFTYDQILAGYGVGRLTTATDAAGYEKFGYDERGRVVAQERSIDGAVATTGFDYDSADRLIEIVYPDGEISSRVYGAAGQLIAIPGVIDDIDYDFLGRTERIDRANDTVDTRTFYGGQEGFRLQGGQTKSCATSGVYLDLTYTYNEIGKLDTISDLRDAAPDPLSNDATYTYDGIGRLKAITGSSSNGTFSFDHVGNLTSKNGKVLSYNLSAQPHQVESYDSAPINYYEESGRRQSKTDGSGETENYSYNVLGQLSRVYFAVSADSVNFGYDHTGRRVVKTTNGAEKIRFFNAHAESHESGTLAKHYWIGDLLVASVFEDHPEFAGLAAPIVIPSEWILGLWCLIILLIAGAGLQLVSGRPERVVAARALGAAVLLVMSGAPALLFPEPAAACGGGGGGGGLFVGLRHYHFDHLGSVQVLTHNNGGLNNQIRYEAYGDVRKRVNFRGNDLSDPSEYLTREFTGHEADFTSGLIYAGARYYDPELGQFLTHDPADQFASPYAYGPGDPVNGSDPTGTWFILALKLVAGLAYIASVAHALWTAGPEGAGIAILLSAAGLAVGNLVGAAGAAMGGLGSIGEIAANPVTQATLLAASSGLSIANTAGASGNGLEIASYVVAGLSLALAFAGARSDTANGAEPGESQVDLNADPTEGAQAAGANSDGRVPWSLGNQARPDQSTLITDGNGGVDIHLGDAGTGLQRQGYIVHEGVHEGQMIRTMSNPEILAGQPRGRVLQVPSLHKNSFERQAWTAQINFLEANYQRMGFWQRSFSSEGAQLRQWIGDAKAARATYAGF